MAGKAALALVVAAAALLPGCSGSPHRSGQDASGAKAGVQGGVGAQRSAGAAAPTVQIHPLRSYPPPERLPAFKAVRITAANFPAGLAAAPDGRIFYSELWGGKVRVIHPDGTVDPVPWADVNRLYGIRWTRFYHGGLSGIAFDPAFEQNRFVYVVTQIPSKRTGLPAKTLIPRFKDVQGRGRSPRVILTIRADVYDNTYSLVFGPDGMLYVPSGFLGESRPASADPLADRRGKILRVTRNGQPPRDNPFGARAPLVWASGFKNAFDLAFFPETSLAVAGESGPEAHDEINIVTPGSDYGYPDHQGVTSAKGVMSPLLDYGPRRTSPVGVLYYTGSRYPSLRGRFLMCENHGRGMLALRIDRSDPGRLRRMTPLVPDCTIDLIQARDGSVVFSDAIAIYRLVQR